MALPTVAAVSATAPSAAPSAGRSGFSEALKLPPDKPPSEVEPRRISSPSRGVPRVAAGAERAIGSCPAPGAPRVQATNAPQAAQWVDGVAKASAQLDAVLRLAERGKSFTPAELVALQAKVYRASQELDLAGKVVEKATGGVKQVLQTQL